MDPTSCYQKTDSTFYVKKTGKKLVSQNFEPLKSNIMLENSILSSPFLLFCFVYSPRNSLWSKANPRKVTKLSHITIDARCVWASSKPLRSKKFLKKFILALESCKLFGFSFFGFLAHCAMCLFFEKKSHGQAQVCLTYVVRFL